MSPKITAYCGLICTECPAFIATQEDDLDKLKTLAQEWYGKEDNTDYCLCDGCTTDGRKNNFCQECGVHLCAKQRGVINCAYCDDFSCETLTALFEHIPLAKENLSLIRTNL
jgi:hypothetical protein